MRLDGGLASSSKVETLLGLPRSRFDHLLAGPSLPTLLVRGRQRRGFQQGFGHLLDGCSVLGLKSSDLLGELLVRTWHNPDVLILAVKPEQRAAQGSSRLI